MHETDVCCSMNADTHTHTHKPSLSFPPLFTFPFLRTCCFPSLCSHPPVSVDWPFVSEWRVSKDPKLKGTYPQLRFWESEADVVVVIERLRGLQEAARAWRSAARPLLSSPPHLLLSSSPPVCRVLRVFFRGHLLMWMKPDRGLIVLADGILKRYPSLPLVSFCLPNKVNKFTRLSVPPPLPKKGGKRIRRVLVTHCEILKKKKEDELPAGRLLSARLHSSWEEARRGGGERAATPERLSAKRKTTNSGEMVQMVWGHGQSIYVQRDKYRSVDFCVVICELLTGGKRIEASEELRQATRETVSLKVFSYST